MKKLDLYLIKKFLGTFFFSIALIIAISLVFDFSENVDEFIQKEVPTKKIIFDYYLHFIPYFANLFIFIIPSSTCFIDIYYIVTLAKLILH